MSAVRGDRQEAIRQIVRDGSIRTQSELVLALEDRGYSVTQATVSRDIGDMNLQKTSKGIYVLAEDLRLATMAANLIRETRRAANQVLILTEPGSAQSVAAALDASAPTGMLGCIAGDDTILVITADTSAGEMFQKGIDRLIVR